MNLNPPKLKPCPFCGSKAEIHMASWTAIEYVRCSNKKCLVRPTTYENVNNFNYMSRDEAKQLSINFWNNRNEN